MKVIPFLVVAAVTCAHVQAQAPVKNVPPTPVQQAEALYIQGVAAEKAGDPVAAQNAYAAALNAKPNHAQARYALNQVKINAASIAARGREAKFGLVMIPEYKLDEARFQEALDALRLMVEKESKGEVAANFVVQDPQNKLATAKISLRLKSVPSRAVLNYVLEMAGAKARHDEYAIVITPR